MPVARQSDRELAEWLSLELDDSRVSKYSKNSSSTKPASPWKRKAQRAAVAVVLLFIVVSIVLAIALPIVLPRARRAAAAAAEQSAGSCPTAPTVTRLGTSNMSLVFEDTFQGFNTSTWRYDMGDGSIYGLTGFGNYEMQVIQNRSFGITIVCTECYLFQRSGGTRS
jgi:hypothetical protein